jgi:3',5'-cyclic-AMP phosphodiesterase
MGMELTTVADDEVVFYDAGRPKRYQGLEPDTDYTFEGQDVRTLPRRGELLSRVCTVNDVHFGETECGILDSLTDGPVFRSAPGEEPYVHMMNRHAVAEIRAFDADAVVVKGDITTRGTLDEYRQFTDVYAPLEDRLHVVRGNHDAYHGEKFAAEAPFRVDLPGVTLAVIDTTIPGKTPGRVTASTIEWIDQVGEDADRPVLLFGHHHAWSPESRSRPDDYFGINPDDSEKLVEVVARHPRLTGYFAGHTHRNRVRRFAATGDVPWVEVGTVKDFPGAWAEYRIFEGGILQIVRRVSHPDALAWTEKTRAMFGGLYPDYAFGALEERCFVVT